MSKKNNTELLEALRILDPKLLMEEIRSDVVKYFTSEDLRTFVVLGNNISLMSVVQVNRVTIVR